MKKALTFIFTILVTSVLAFAQSGNRYEEAVSLLNQGKAEELKTYLEKWEEEEPQHSEIFPLWLNYYYYISGEEVVELVKEPPVGGQALVMTDSLGKPAGYMLSRIVYDAEVLAKGYEKIDQGIALYPDRLDFYFGKTHLLMNCSNDAAAAVALLSSVMDRHMSKSGSWTWTMNEPLENEEERLISSVQDYIAALFDIGDLDNAAVLIERALKSYPENVMFLSDKAGLAFNKGDMKMALKQYLKILEIAPEDYLVMTNVAYLSELTGDVKNARKYYQMVKDSNDPEFAPIAVSALDALNNK